VLPCMDQPEIDPPFLQLPDQGGDLHKVRPGSADQEYGGVDLAHN
jgi:hypothetical protein